MPDEDLKSREPTLIEPETGEKPVIKVSPPQKDYEERKKIIRNRRLVWYVLTIVEVILALRFLIKLFGANPSSFFSILITLLSAPFALIFIGLFPSLVSSVGDVVIEWSTLFAMFFYAVVALVVSLFFRLKKPIDPHEAEKKAEETIP